MSKAAIALIWASACLMGLFATIILIKGVLMLIFGFGCLILMVVFLYFAAKHLILKDDV